MSSDSLSLSERLAKSAARQTAENTPTQLLRKMIIDHLKMLPEKRETIANVSKAIGIEIEEAVEAYRTFLRAPVTDVLHMDGDVLVFTPEFDIQTKDDLVDLLRDRYDKGLGGISTSKLNEYNPNIFKLRDKALAEHEVFVLDSKKKKTPQMLFYNNVRAYSGISLDRAYKRLWNSVVAADLVEVERFLERSGIPVLKPNEDASLHSDSKEPKKRKVRTKPVKLVNIHLRDDNYGPLILPK